MLSKVGGMGVDEVVRGQVVGYCSERGVFGYGLGEWGAWRSTTGGGG